LGKLGGHSGLRSFGVPVLPGHTCSCNLLSAQFLPEGSIVPDEISRGQKALKRPGEKEKKIVCGPNAVN
jgi:hypothetical protein